MFFLTLGKEASLLSIFFAVCFFWHSGKKLFVECPKKTLGKDLDSGSGFFGGQIGFVVPPRCFNCTDAWIDWLGVILRDKVMLSCELRRPVILY